MTKNLNRLFEYGICTSCVAIVVVGAYSIFLLIAS